MLRLAETKQTKEKKTKTNCPRKYIIKIDFLLQIEYFFCGSRAENCVFRKSRCSGLSTVATCRVKAEF